MRMIRARISDFRTSINAFATFRRPWALFTGKNRAKRC